MIGGKTRYLRGMERSAPANAAITTRQLSKRYGETYALREANLTIPTGTIYGFLGPNGAGKTTTIRLLMGFIRATSGEARIFGHDCWNEGLEARADLGFLVMPDALYADMSGEAQLDYAARLSRRAPVLRETLLDALELSRRALRQRLGSYSKGMRQKLALIAAMQHDPALLILDEPTDGLDPLIQHRFEDQLMALRNRGRTIFMSSHDLAEVERTCEIVAVIRKGQIVAEETIAELLRRHSRRVSLLFADAIPADLDQIPGIAITDITGKRVELSLGGKPVSLLRALARYDIDDITITPPTLEDIFISYYDQQPEQTEAEPA